MSAHTNYLIQIFKELTGRVARSREAHYTRPTWVVNGFFYKIKENSLSKKLQGQPQLLPNYGPF